MRHERWIIECRDADGALCFSAPQPESVFGTKAIQGISEDEMAQVIFAMLRDEDIKIPLHGTNISQWPRNLNPLWSARRKTW